MLALLFSFLGGPIASAVVSAYRAKLDAMGSANGMAVDLAKAELDAQIEARKQATSILLAEQGHWYTACIRSLFALPFVAFCWANVVGTDILGIVGGYNLDPSMSSWGMIVITAYFGEHITSQITRIIKR